MGKTVVEISFVLFLAAFAWFNGLGFQGISFENPLSSEGGQIEWRQDAFSSMKNTLGPWYDAVVWPEEVDAAIWADKNLPRKELFAADLFACEMLAAVARKTCSIGGAWELADRPNERFQDNEKAFLSNFSKEKYTLLTKYGIKYVFASNRQAFYAYGWKYPELEKFGNELFFEKIYDEKGVKIWKVKYQIFK